MIQKRKVRWVENVALMREMRNASRILIRKPGGIRPFGRPRRRWDTLNWTFGK
jgi:hypothetical protein